MRKLVTILSVVIIATSAQASSLPEFPFVFAQGHAEAEHAPDKAVVSFRVKAFDATPSNAVAVIRARSQELLEFFAEHKIKKENIEAYEIDKDIIRDRETREEPKILGYAVTRRFSITLRDLQSYEPFAKKLMVMENVESITTEFDRTDRKKIEADLILSASKDAREQGENLASGFGKDLGDVYAISQQGFGIVAAVFGIPGEYYGDGISYCMSGPDEDAFLFVPSTITFDGNVMVLFKLKN
jgi:uncharacterized protein YggE